jgi:PKD repeat protein/uncharacterized protein YraI
MSFWNTSSTAVKTALVVGAAALLLLLIFLIANLGGSRTPDTGAPERSTPVASATATSEVESTPTATPEAGNATVTAENAVNVRLGPGTDYLKVGLLLTGQSAAVLGRNADASWWAIDFPIQPTNVGWVAADFVTATNAGNVPVLAAPVAPAPTLAPPVAITAWRGAYYDNPNLDGDPVFVRNDEQLDFNWGSQPPAAGMPATNWSARWTINRNVPAGTYRFSAWVDDGIRVYVDNQLLIDGWLAGTARNYQTDVNLSAGAHSVRVEYFQGTGDALLQLSIGYVEGFPEWKAEYYGNTNLEGAATLVRNESSIDHDWGTSPPAPGLPADSWSARWSRSYDLAAGEYTLTADVAGGVRIWIEDQLLIDAWSNEPQRLLSADTGELNAGRYQLRVEYFKERDPGRLLVTGAEADGDPIPPKAVIQGPSRAVAGDEVTFSAIGSEVAAGSHIQSVNWDFGDGSSAQGVSVTHVFAKAGIYNIVLTVTDDKGLSDNDTQQIRISDESSTPEAPQPPIAVIDAPAQGQVGLPITFYAGNSQSVNPISSYQWDFGDGTTADAVSVQKTFNEADVFTVSLTVIDDNGLTSIAEQQIAIRESDPPVVPTPTGAATLEPPVAPTAEAPAATAAPTADVAAEPPDATGVPEVDLPIAPTEPVVLVTVDGVEVEPIITDGTATIQLAAGQRLAIDASAALEEAPDLVFTWDMGDGSPPKTGPAFEHSYAEPGTFTISIDIDNGAESATTVWEAQVTE